MIDIFHPETTLLVKLGSIARHAEEQQSPWGRPEDANAIKALLSDPEVSEWMQQADALALLPVMRAA